MPNFSLAASVQLDTPRLASWHDNVRLGELNYRRPVNAGLRGEVFSFFAILNCELIVLVAMMIAQK